MKLCVSRRPLAALCFSLACLWTAGAGAQRYAPDGSVIPDPVTRPEDSSAPTVLRPEDTRADPACRLTPCGPILRLSPDDAARRPVLSPDAVRADPVLSPDAVRPDPVRRAD